MQLKVLLKGCVVSIRTSLRAHCLRTHRSVWTTLFRALVGWRFKLGQLHLAQAAGRKRHCFCRALPRFRQGATEEAPYISGIYNCFASFCNILGPVLRKAEAMP